jgi:uncharacterized OB-fold protein
MTAVVYSVTKLHAAGEAFEQQLPFQLALIELPDGARTTVRIVGPPVAIGDPVMPDPAIPGCWRRRLARD